jgi:hypothetical protein
LLSSISRQGRLILRHKIASSIPEPIVQLQRDLEQFRGSHPPRTRLPESLWQSAVELARQHGLYLVAHPLRLDYVQLKKRLGGVAKAPSTTVVDRRPVEAIRAFGSDSVAHGIDVFFAIGTSAADVQRRAIRARADV